MEEAKKKILIKVVGLILLITIGWLIGYLSGLRLGLEITSQKEQNLNQNAPVVNNNLPQIPAVPDNHRATANNLIPQIPAVK